MKFLECVWREVRYDNKGMLSPNAGIDASNAPENAIRTLLTRRSQASAQQIQHALQQHYLPTRGKYQRQYLHNLRLSTVGIAIWHAAV
ncbi:MAG: hypothetical protein AEth_01718 [Candidatus Argoarchaeum ethanivorans]|uniref:Coenzyme F420:L-glutamate ligase-like domain-containing protein n=1 Tax=Candidatus Argoarchaeum ethanivorans TaxID=2608793 RepID=A0A8B3S0L8_9EURY|nr:MAG: hypothetical protein AEth_01718 [Candidatus Argoarchaeum ethanivorans]